MARYKLVFGVIDISNSPDKEAAKPDWTERFDVHELSQIVVEIDQGKLNEIADKARGDYPSLADGTVAALQRSYVQEIVDCAFSNMSRSTAGALVDPMGRVVTKKVVDHALGLKEKA
jgi:hypothetical protein